MSKRKGWVIVGVVAVILLIVIVWIFVFPKHYEAIAVTDNLKFGMMPFEVRMRYGQPEEIQKNTIAPEITYIYYGDIDGHLATFYFTFTQSLWRYELYRSDIHIDAEEEELPKIYNMFVKRCCDEYQSDDSSYKKNDVNEMLIDITNGATILTCRIWTEQAAINITVIKNW